MSEYLSLVSLDPMELISTMIPTWINLLLLYFILKKVLYNPITNILEQRKNEVDGIYTSAREKEEEAKGLVDEYTKKLAVSKEEASEIIKNANVYAKKNEEAILEEARNEAANLITKANMQIEQEKKKTYENIKTDISELSIAIAQKIIQKEISKEEHEALILEFIENVGEEK